LHIILFHYFASVEQLRILLLFTLLQYFSVNTTNI